MTDYPREIAPYIGNQISTTSPRANTKEARQMERKAQIAAIEMELKKYLQDYLRHLKVDSEQRAMALYEDFCGFARDFYDRTPDDPIGDVFRSYVIRRVKAVGSDFDRDLSQLARQFEQALNRSFLPDPKKPLLPFPRR